MHRALITGASRGIGRAIAVSLASRGMHLGLVARTAGALDEVCTACEQAGGTAQRIVADLSRPEAPATVVAQAQAALGGIDVLVNNAGQVVFDRVGEGDLSTWDEILAVNTRAVIHLTHHAMPLLRAAKRAAIINIASVSSKNSHAGGAIYCASKHALLGFSNCLFEDVRNDHIKVCAICPGYVATDMIRGGGVDMDRAIKATDIAQTVLYVLDSGPTACPTEIVVRPQQSM